MYFVCCKILGIKPGADEETIKAAYRKSAKELHPDVNTSEKAEEYFMLLKNAYEYLMTHRYSEEEIRILWLQRQRREKVMDKRMEHHNIISYRPARTAGFTLREVLRESRTARVIYIAFHILFLFVGFWLIYHSAYDILFHEPYDKIHKFSAYFTVVFGFFFGIMLTGTFLVTGISFIRKRM